MNFKVQLKRKSAAQRLNDAFFRMKNLTLPNVLPFELIRFITAVAMAGAHHLHFNGFALNGSSIYRTAHNAPPAAISCDISLSIEEHFTLFSSYLAWP